MDTFVFAKNKVKINYTGKKVKNLIFLPTSQIAIKRYLGLFTQYRCLDVQRLKIHYEIIKKKKNTR